MAYAGIAIGLALFTAIVAYHGFGEVAGALAVAGRGLLGLAAYHVTSLVTDAIGWRRLLPPADRRRLAVLVFSRWIGESVNNLLPVMQLGGNVVRARYLARSGVPGPLAGASVVVDVTLEVLTQVLFTLLGLALLLGRVGGRSLLFPASLGAALMALLAGAFLFAQRAGLFSAAARTLSRLGGAGSAVGLVDDAAALDRSVAAVYKDWRALLSSSAWHMAGWILGAGEVWLALHLLGHGIDPSGALVLESLGAAVRGAAFAVPGALGVQEGGFVVLGGVLGLTPETSLALSLSKRAREILFGLPGLVAWQVDRGVAWQSATRAPAAPGGSEPVREAPREGVASCSSSSATR